MLRFMDGFDYAATAADVKSKWGAFGGGGTFGLVTGRNGGQALALTGTFSDVGRVFDNQQFWYVGFAVYRTSVASGVNLLTFYDGSNEQISVGFQNNGNSKLAFLIGGVTAKTTTGGETSLSVNTWYYIEVKIKITNSVASGDCSIYVNGSLYTSLATGQSSRNGSTNNYANKVFIGQTQNFSTAQHNFDDVYICDSQGTTNNSLLGPCYVSTLYPTGAGASTQWTPNSGTNYSRVNEATQNGDTTYNSTSGVGNRDSYTIASLSDNPNSIYGIQQSSFVRIDASETTRTVNNSIRSGGSYTDGATSGNLTSTYSWLNNILATDPNTGVAWTKSGLSSAEAGIKLVS